MASCLAMTKKWVARTTQLELWTTQLELWTTQLELWATQRAQMTKPFEEMPNPWVGLRAACDGLSCPSPAGKRSEAQQVLAKIAAPSA